MENKLEVYGAILPGLHERKHIGMYELVANKDTYAVDVENFANQFHDISDLFPKEWFKNKLSLEDSKIRVYRMSDVCQYEKIMDRMKSFCKNVKSGKAELIEGKRAKNELTNLLPHIVEDFCNRYSISKCIC